MIGNSDPIDAYAKRFFDGTYLQYHTLEKPLFEKGNYYLNIFGTYIIEASIDSETAKNVDELYKKTQTFDESIISALQALVANGKTKLTISRNARKAAKLKKLFAPYFFAAK